MFSPAVQFSWEGDVSYWDCLFLSALKSRPDVDRIRGKAGRKQSRCHLSDSALGGLVVSAPAGLERTLPVPSADQAHKQRKMCYCLKLPFSPQSSMNSWPTQVVLFVVVLLSLFLGSSWHKLKLCRKREPQLRKCSIRLTHGNVCGSIFLTVIDVGGPWLLCSVPALRRGPLVL